MHVRIFNFSDKASSNSDQNGIEPFLVYFLSKIFERENHEFQRADYEIGYHAHTGLNCTIIAQRVFQAKPFA